MTKITELDIVRSRTEILLFNPFHEKSSGRFTSKQGTVGVTAGASPKLTGSEKAAVASAQAVYGVGGAAIGALGGHFIGAVVGGVVAVVATTKFGVKPEEAAEIARKMSTAGSVAGIVIGGVSASRGARKQAIERIQSAKEKRARKEMSDVLSDVELQEARGAASLLGALQAFLKTGKRRFAVYAEDNPEFEKFGFKKEGKYLYAGRDIVEMLIKVISEMKP